MKQFLYLGLLGMMFVLSACGSGTARDLTGDWNAQLNDSGGASPFSFGTSITQTGTTIAVTNVNFSPFNQSCFNTQISQLGVFAKTGHSNGVETGTLSLTISTMFPGALNNVLTLQGTRNSDGSITGTWTVVGQTGCNDSGTFSMNQHPPV